MLYLLKTLFVIDVLMATGFIIFRWALPHNSKHIASPKFVILAMTTPAVALFSGNLYLFFAYLTAITAINSRSRIDIASFYAFILPLMPILATETNIGSVYLLSISTVSAINLGTIIGFATTQKSYNLRFNKYDMLALATAFLFIFIDNRDPNPTMIIRGITIYFIGVGVPYIVMSRSISKRTDFDKVLLSLCLGATLSAVVACFQAKTHWVLFETYYKSLQVPLPSLSASLSLRAGLLRTGGAMVDYSAGGLFLAAILTMMPFLRPRFKPAGFWMVFLTLAAGLVASQSRGAWVAAIVGLVFVAAYRGLWTRVAILAGGAIAAETLILLFATSGRLASIAGKTDEATESVSYRKRLFSQGMDQIWNHPLFGQTPNQLIDNLPDLVQGQHIVDFVNTHLFIAMAAGIPLFLLWLSIWATPVIDAWKHRKGRNPMLEPAAAIVITSMTAMTFTSIIDRNMTWPIIALGLAACCSRMKQGSIPHVRPRQRLIANKSSNRLAIG